MAGVFEGFSVTFYIANMYDKTNGLKGNHKVNGHFQFRCKIAKDIEKYSLNLLLQYILGWNIMFLDNFRGKILSRIGVV